MRITELPQATSVAQTDDLAIDVPGGRTYKVPRSILAPSPYVVTIPTGQWSGSGSDRYITISASNVTADAMLYPFYDNASGSLLKGPVWTIPANGSFTIHTTSIPAGTVTISVLFAGILGEAQYQVLADVYSKSQTYSKTETDSAIAQSTATMHTYSGANGMLIYRIGRLAQFAVFPNTSTTASDAVIGTITESAFRPSSRLWFATKVYNGSAYIDCFVEITTDGVISIKNNMGGIVAGCQGQYVQARGTTYICVGA